MLCFVEVKARSRTDYGNPEESFIYYKQKRLLSNAFNCLESKKIGSKDMGFDFASVDLNNEETKLIKNAFDVNYF